MRGSSGFGSARRARRLVRQVNRLSEGFHAPLGSGFSMSRQILWTETKLDPYHIDMVEQGSIPAAGVNIWMIDRGQEAALGRLERIAVGDGDLELKRTLGILNTKFAFQLISILSFPRCPTGLFSGPVMTASSLSIASPTCQHWTPGGGDSCSIGISFFSLVDFAIAVVHGLCCKSEI